MSPMIATPVVTQTTPSSFPATKLHTPTINSDDEFLITLARYGKSITSLSSYNHTPQHTPCTNDPIPSSQHATPSPNLTGNQPVFLYLSSPQLDIKTKTPLTDGRRSTCSYCRWALSPRMVSGMRGSSVVGMVVA